jgi:transcriptional regulator with XRE-family HTH domain
MLRKQIVDMIIQIRKEKGISQEMLASETGLDRTYISSVERLKRNLTLDSLEKIIIGLGITKEEFFKSDIFHE